ncbi:uncharacterized protein [Ptychodera flava]|uniref:uncharacterized protein n=1 Tax=Ptychodera flava TaxID=63121 RepID=UPI00396A04D4
MLGHALLVFLSLVTYSPSLQTTSPSSCKMLILHVWPTSFVGVFNCRISEPMDLGWTMEVNFDKGARNLKTWNVDTVSNFANVNLVLENQKYNEKLLPGDYLNIPFTSEYTGAIPHASVKIVPKTSAPPSTVATDVSDDPAVPTSYNYGEVMHKSILFFEAQRSGKLSINNRVPWRGDSGLSDGADNGVDLTGGWYDAGDFLKLNFPMAFAVTALSWGYIEYPDAYEATGETDNMLDCIKWATDYLKKCHTAKNEFYYQVGSVGADHGNWGRPEEMTMERPSYKATPESPGSNVAGEAAAALAAASMVFRKSDPTYSETLLQNAKELFEFANDYRGNYECNNVYKSSSFGDELCWAALWLYRATNDQTYYDTALAFYSEFKLGGGSYAFSWGSKKVGIQVLICKLSKGQHTLSCSAVDAFLKNWLVGGSIPRTPKGLVFRTDWGSLRYSAATALIALLAADEGINPTVYRDLAKKQIHYMLGSSGRSFVVGYGVNPPVRPHHRSSTCPDPPQTCSWANFRTTEENAHVLEGALVGGPFINDTYLDERPDYYHNEVACDYNAPFQSAVAGLKHLELIGQL